MTHVITAIPFPETIIKGNSSTKNQKLIQYLAMLLIFCFFALTSFAQPKGSKPDPNETYGKGSRIRTTQSTNPDSFIPETKTEYFDENDVLREEIVQSSDLDGNRVTIRKKYDKTGLPQSSNEIRRDGIGSPVFEEDIEYDESGKIKKANKRIGNKGKWFYFDFDQKKQQYKEDRSYGYVKPEPSKEQFVCSCSKTEIKAGYSYMRTGNSGISGTLPTGVEISAGYRLNSHFGLILDVNGHQNNQNFQKLNRLSFQAGMQYDVTKCDDDDNVAIYSRIGIGITLEHVRVKATTVSATAASGTAGLGANIKIFRKTSLYLSADWAPSYFNKTLQNNFQAGAGLAFKFGSK